MSTFFITAFLASSLGVPFACEVLFLVILTFLTMHVRRHSGVIFQTLGTPFHLRVSFAVSGKTCLLYSVCDAAMSVQAVQVC